MRLWMVAPIWLAVSALFACAFGAFVNAGRDDEDSVQSREMSREDYASGAQGVH